MVVHLLVLDVVVLHVVGLADRGERGMVEHILELDLMEWYDLELDVVELQFVELHQLELGDLELT